MFKNIKGLSVRQPWATMIVDGRKSIETRKWRTKYRGEVAIHASARPRVGGLPVGGIVGVAELIDCRPMTAADEVAACCKVYPGAFSWVLADIRSVEFIPCKGMLGALDSF